MTDELNLLENTMLISHKVYSELEKEKKTVYVPIRFSFMSNNYGPRPGKLVTILGPTGSGKSTVVRDLLKDITLSLGALDTTLVVLSEETSLDYKFEFHKLVEDPFQKAKVHIISEMDPRLSTACSNYLNWEMYLEEKILELEPKIMIIDNITTGAMDGWTFTQKGHFINWVKKVSVKYNIATIIVAHTASSYKTSSGLITPEDIRGSKTTTNISEFIYIIQPITIDGNRHTFVHVEKCRGYDNSGYFKLIFDKATRSFTRDVKTTFDDFKQLFNKRDRV
jgi:type IV secretory pathway VirB4 component